MRTRAHNRQTSFVLVRGGEFSAAIIKRWEAQTGNAALPSPIKRPAAAKAAGKFLKFAALRNLRILAGLLLLEAMLLGAMLLGAMLLGAGCAGWRHWKDGAGIQNHTQ